MNYSNLVLVLFGLSTTFIFRNVEARLDADGIVGGDEAIEGQFKYQVSIQADNFHICGGGILADEYVLTAAHCVVNEEGKFAPDELEVVVGVLKYNTAHKSAVRVKVEKAYIPQAYEPVKPDPNLPYRDIGDIAVLKLKNGLGLRGNAKLRELKLPVKIGSRYPSYDNENVIIVGYGYTWVTMGKDPETKESIEEDGGSIHKLKFAEATVSSNAACSRLHIHPVYDSHLCAAVTQRNPENPEGVCSGDSGGPLVHNGDTVIGVVSDSPLGCSEKNISAVYTRVSSFIPFIKNAMKGVKTDDMRVTEWKV